MSAVLLRVLRSVALKRFARLGYAVRYLGCAKFSIFCSKSAMREVTLNNAR
jgi:hypothetical protein